MTRLHDLYRDQAQSPWLDNIRRGWITSGELAGWVDRGVRGLTSNPSIFQKAIQGSQEYDAEFTALWGFANPDEEWRNLVLSPRYPASADLARDMWAALGRPPVDGVLMVDIAALREL